MACLLTRNLTHSCEYNSGGITDILLLDIRNFDYLRFKDDGLFDTCYVESIHGKSYLSPIRLSVVDVSEFTEEETDGIYSIRLNTFVRGLDADKTADLLTAKNNRYIAVVVNSDGKSFIFGSENGAVLKFTQTSGTSSQTANGYNLTITNESTYPLFEFNLSSLDNGGVDVIELNIPDNSEETTGFEVIDIAEQIPVLLAKFRRCMCKMNGQSAVNICYLDDNDSNFYADGTPADLNGNDGDIMVTIPEFWYKITHEGNNTNIKISLLEIPGFIHSQPSLMGAFISNSRPDTPENTEVPEISYINKTASLNFPDVMRKYRNYIKGEKNKYWTNTTFTQAYTVVLMHMLKYKDRNIRNTIGIGRGVSNTRNMGVGATASMGINDTTPQNGGEAETGTLTNFMGLEGFFGAFGQFLHQDDGYITNNEIIRLLDYAISDEPIEMQNPIENPDYIRRAGILQMQIGIRHNGQTYLGMFPTKLSENGYNTLTHWASNFMYNTLSNNTLDTKLCVGGYYSIVDQYSSNTYDDLGISSLYLCRITNGSSNLLPRAIRIAFHGNITVIENPSEFKNL